MDAQLSPGSVVSQDLSRDMSQDIFPSGRASIRSLQSIANLHAPMRLGDNWAGCKTLRELDCLNEAALVSDPAARYIERGAMIDRSPDDGQAQRDVDARQLRPFAGRRVNLKAEQLDGDVSLVVVHRNDRIVLARPQLDENGITGDRPDDVEPLDDRFSDNWRGHVDILAAEQTSVARMRI